MLTTLLTINLVAFSVVAGAVAPSQNLLHIGGQGINLWKLQRRVNNTRSNSPKLEFQTQSDGSRPFESDSLGKKYPAFYFQQPIDHNDSSVGTFNQRYWVDDRFYRPGGPVFVLDGGETSGAERLPFLDHGILAM